MLKYAFIAAFGIFVCYHYFPKETVSTGKTAFDKTTRATKQLGTGVLKAGEEVIK